MPEAIEKSAEKVMTLGDLRESKIYVRNNISYMPPKELIDPFADAIELGEDDEVRIEIQNPIINQNMGGEENIAYPRFLVEAKRSSHVFEDVKYNNVFGMLVAMDQQKGVVKTYSGMNVQACTNLCIFNAQESNSQDIMSDLSTLFELTAKYHENNDAKLENYRSVHRTLAGTLLAREELNERLGYALRASFGSKLGSTPIVQAAKLINDKRSIYYAEAESTLYNLYNAVTQSITSSKDLLYAPDKTIAVGEILGIIATN